MDIFKQITFGATIRFIIDFALVWGLVYLLLKLLRKNERAGQIIKGFLIIVVARNIATWIGLKIISRFLAEFMNWGVLFIIIIFAPEIRNALENVGKKTIFGKTFKLQNNEKDYFMHELLSAVEEFSSTYTGALISIEMNDSLKGLYHSGTEINGNVSKTLLANIFYPKTALHDGAVIIQGNKIAVAAAFFTPTINQIHLKYGARHRAAMGISEVCDCITIIVSEETGDISIARFGEIFKVSLTQLQQYLSHQLLVENTEKKVKKSNIFQEYILSSSMKTENTNAKYETLDNGQKIRVYYRLNGEDSDE